MASASARRHYVTLEDDPDHGTRAVFTPPALWVAIRPTPPGLGDSDHQTHLVECPYHAQINTDTTLVWGARRLSVMGVQNVEERNRELVLYCEEVKTP